MTERPINLYPHEVRGIIAGPQTQLRRIVKPQPELRNVAGAAAMWCFRRRGSDGYWLWPNAAQDVLAECPFGVPGDRLWGREAFKHCYNGSGAYQIIYVADRERRDFSSGSGGDTDVEVAWLAGALEVHGERGRPSTHMPRWASRILLEITDVRVQRVQEISEEDAAAEGIVAHRKGGWWWEQPPPGIAGTNHVGAKTARDAYRALWEIIYGPDSWPANPWVWALTFRRLKP